MSNKQSAKDVADSEKSTRAKSAGASKAKSYHGINFSRRRRRLRELGRADVEEGQEQSLADAYDLINNDDEQRELDSVRDELLDAVEQGAIREGYTEEGIPTSDEPAPNVVNLSDIPVNQGSTTENLRSDAVDISKLPTERSRNQSQPEGDSYVAGGLHITRSQNSNIRNSKIERENMSKKRRSAKKTTKTLMACASVLLCLVLLGGGAFAWYRLQLRSVHYPVHEGEAFELRPFAVAEGESSAQIAANLKSRGFVNSALAFKIYLRAEAPNKMLKSGNYMLAENMSVADIIQELNNGTNAKTRTLTFLPGETLASAKKVLLDAGYASEEIDQAFAKQYNGPLFAGCPQGNNIEGYLHGDTYEVYENSSVEQILTTKIFPEMEKYVVEHKLADAFEAKGLSLYEGITLASIVYRESGAIPGDMAKVAQVFLNRLAQGMPLGSDAVVAYRADQLNPNRAKDDLSGLATITCPWNSRNCTGLPPSPIAAPSFAALQAVAEPVEHDYLYFVTGDDYKMYYAHTLEEHQQNVQQHCHELCKVM